MPETPASTNPSAGRAELEQLQHLATLLAVIARKAMTRVERDPAAIEIVELAEKAAAVVAEMVQARI